MSSNLPLTGERTIPGIDHENYWFRRHEVVYDAITDACADADVLEAGCGEGYGADLLAGVARSVQALDYDEQTVAHVRARYPRVEVSRANLVTLPVPDESIDVVVSLQVIEHLWDQERFLTECRRVLRPGGRLIVSTPNRITFTPDSDTPLNPFHTRELDPGELAGLVRDAGFGDVVVQGLHHGPRLREMDERHGGLIAEQTRLALSGEAWPEALVTDVAAVRAADFELYGDEPGHTLDDSLDLLVTATR
ncbi:class I SAM-dependent methyltransferase [Pseudonocardia phyllosphaerae]|uniref:class I SAM-dependent methyltransferase n=1 Tax=Pseudonocardia phyllosphaerae TaxID=3390502 RepID=UPI00397C880A